MGPLPCPFPVLFPQRCSRPFTAPSSLVSQKGAGVHGAVGPSRRSLHALCHREGPGAVRPARSRLAPLQGCTWHLCMLPCSLRASVRQVGATAEDTSTRGQAGNWQAVHSQLSERVSTGLLPQLLQKGKEQGIHTAIGEGNGNPLQYSCLENPTDGGAWRAAVRGVAQRRTRLSDFTYTHCAVLCLAAQFPVPCLTTSYFISQV